MVSQHSQEVLVSHDRVSEYGEVFTPVETVRDMTDLLGQNTERFDCVVLEPSCGNGNFLVEILARRLRMLRKTYIRSQFEYEHYLFVATSTLYGIELVFENLLECRSRLLSKVKEFYVSDFNESANLRFVELLNLVLTKNIIHGNFLTGMNLSNSSKIEFTQWTFFKTQKLKRRDFIMGAPSLSSDLVLSKDYDLIDAFSLLEK